MRAVHNIEKREQLNSLDSTISHPPSLLNDPAEYRRKPEHSIAGF